MVSVTTDIDTLTDGFAAALGAATGSGEVAEAKGGYGGK